MKLNVQSPTFATAGVRRRKMGFSHFDSVTLSLSPVEDRLRFREKQGDKARGVDTEPTRNGGIFFQLNISKLGGKKKVLYRELWSLTSGCGMLDR